MNIKHNILIFIILGFRLVKTIARGPSAAANSSNEHKLVQINQKFLNGILSQFLTLNRFTLCRVSDSLSLEPMSLNQKFVI